MNLFLFFIFICILTIILVLIYKLLSHKNQPHSTRERLQPNITVPYCSKPDNTQNTETTLIEQSIQNNNALNNVEHNLLLPIISENTERSPLSLTLQTNPILTNSNKPTIRYTQTDLSNENSLNLLSHTYNEKINLAPSSTQNITQSSRRKKALTIAKYSQSPRHY